MRKEVREYVIRNFGNLVTPSDPMKFDDMWHTQLSVNYPLRMDDGEIYIVSFNGLGELVFDKSFNLIKGTTREELVATLNKVMESLTKMHASQVAQEPIQ